MLNPFEILRKFAMLIAIIGMSSTGWFTLLSERPLDFITYGAFFLIFLVCLVTLNSMKEEV